MLGSVTLSISQSTQDRGKSLFTEFLIDGSRKALACQISVLNHRIPDILTFLKTPNRVINSSRTCVNIYNYWQKPGHYPSQR